MENDIVLQPEYVENFIVMVRGAIANAVVTGLLPLIRRLIRNISMSKNLPCERKFCQLLNRIQQDRDF